MNSSQTHDQTGPSLAILATILLFSYAIMPSHAFGEQTATDLDIRELMSDSELQQTGMSSLSQQELTAFNSWITAFAQKVRRGEIASPAAQYSTTAEYENVLAFPNRYSERTVRFENVSVRGQISRAIDRNVGPGFILNLRTPRGESSSELALESTLPVVINDAMAEQFLSLGLSGDSRYSANVDVRVRKGMQGRYWIAEVIRLELVSRSGSALHTITRD